MKHISSWALDNQKFIIFLIVILVGDGIFSFFNMSKLEDPELEVPKAMVVTVFPGASPQQVEQEVTDVLEKSIRTMGNLDQITSRSFDNVSMIEVGLHTTVPNDQIEQMWDLLRRKVADTQSELPSGVVTSIVKDNFGDVYGMFYAITNDGYDQAEFTKYVELAQREINNIEGISQTILYGEPQECVNIELHQDRMAFMGVHPFEVLSTLSGQNETVYSGYYDSGNQRIRIAVNDKYKDADEISSILIKGHEGDRFRLGDVADVYECVETPQQNSLFYDGKEAVGLLISCNSGTDIIHIGREVESLVAQLQKDRMPSGIEFNKVFYQPDKVRDAISTFLLNLLESVLIVVFILMLSMGFKSGMIIGSSLLVIIIGSVALLHVFNGTLQRVSLGSFILAMGMLVDNAIVIIDGIYIDMKRGVPRREALTNICRKMSLPLLCATLIAILAFLPIFMSPDISGVYVRDMFIVLAVSLLLSWLLSITQVPLQASKYLYPKVEADKDPFDNKYYRKLKKILSWTLTHRVITICVAMLLVCVTLFFYSALPKEFFPDMTYNQLFIEYKMPEGTGNDKVKADLEEISEWLSQRKEITHITLSLGGTPGRYNLVRSIANPSLSYGELIVDYTGAKELETSMQEIQEYLTARYPEAFVRLKRYNLMYKKHPIEARFKGPDPAVLKDLTNRAMNIMKKSDKTTLVCSDWEPQVPVMEVDYSQTVARDIGVNRSDIGMSLLATGTGIPAGTFYRDNKRHTIYLKCVDKDGNPIPAIDDAPVFSLVPSLNSLNKETVMGVVSGNITESDIIEDLLHTVPLSQVTSGINVKYEDPVIIRHNSQRAMRALCNPAFGVSAEEAREDIAAAIEAIPLPVGYSFEWEGEHAASASSTQYLFMYYPLAIALMIAILIFLFKGYRKPLIIILCVVLIPAGVIPFMLISGKSFGFVAIVGVLGLVGMMIKNGIVIMDEIQFQLSTGIAPNEALLNSAAVRFRPVMMTSMTTILGMIPLLSDALFGSLAVTIMGGLFIGTLITLVFLPVLYSLFFNLKIEEK